MTSTRFSRPYRRAIFTPFVLAAVTPFLVGACGAVADNEQTTTPPLVDAVVVEVVQYPDISYPETETVDQVDDYHGTVIADPYRWLEEDIRESERVAEWVQAENEVTFGYLETIPERRRIAGRLEQLWDYEKFGLPRKEAGLYFYSHNKGLQNQNVIYSQKGLAGEREVLQDPNTWSEDGTVALASYSPSPDGRYVAFTIQDGGSDWRKARVMKLDSGEYLDEELEWLKFTGLSWTPDGEGFYYSRYPEPESGSEFQSLNTNQAVYLHRPGTPQSEDELVYTREDHPDWGYSAGVTDEGDYLVTTIWKGTDSRYQILYQGLEAGTDPVMLIEGFDHDYSFLGNDGSEFYFRTDKEAPNGRIIAIDVDRPEEANWREVVPESEHVLRGADLVGGHITASYLEHAQTAVKIYGMDGTVIRTVDFPGIGSAGGFRGKFDDPETFYSFSSYNRPPTIYRYNVATGESAIYREAEVDFDADKYTVEQVFYTSKDGTRVPMFISYKKGIVRNGANPMLLYGYGGFDIPMTPSFSITRLAWMEMGGVYAVANIRGGGEYGETWHKAGTKLQKQNVFDDFIAAAEYLVAEGWTQPRRLAVMGRSNGGLLVGAVVNQRPDLFGAALPAVGVMDMLRYDLFTAGRFWVDDYGSSSNAEEFEALRAYSPYHNIEDGTKYPAILVTTADRDDRVVPGHSFKYAAELQDSQGGEAPVLIRIQTRAGHGAGKPTQKVIEEYADMWAFLLANLGMELPEEYGR